MDDQINYGNKAKNLEFVANHTDIEIPYFRELSLKDLENINEILNDFSEEIMIRSNSSNEDLESSSNAGKYLSIGPISKKSCLLYTSPSPRDLWISRMPSSA